MWWHQDSKAGLNLIPSPPSAAMARRRDSAAMPSCVSGGRRESVGCGGLGAQPGAHSVLGSDSLGSSPPSFFIAPCCELCLGLCACPCMHGLGTLGDESMLC